MIVYFQRRFILRKCLKSTKFNVTGKKYMQAHKSALQNYNVFQEHAFPLCLYSERVHILCFT